MLGFHEGRRARCFVFSFLVVSYLYLLAFCNQGLFIYDEGAAVYGAARVLDAYVPYKDFWTLYGPAEFYVLAALFKLFGVSLLVGRIYVVTMLWAVSFMAYLVTKRIAPQPLAALAWALVVFRLGGYYPSPCPSGCLFSLISCICLLRFLSGGGRNWIVLSGISVGVAALFRHDLAVYTIAAEFVVGSVFMLVSAGKTKTAASIAAPIARAVGFYTLGLAAILIPASVLLFRAVPSSDLVNDLVVFPLTIYPKMRELPFPTFPSPIPLLKGQVSPVAYASVACDPIPFLFSVAVYALTAISIGIAALKRQFSTDNMRLWGILMVLILGLMFFNTARVRSDTYHVIPTVIIALMLFAVLLSQIPATAKARRVYVVLGVIACLAVVVEPISKKASMCASSTRNYHVGVPRAGRIVGDRKLASYGQLVNYVQQVVPPGEQIFVCNTRHDIGRTNDIMLYFLSHRHAATKYYTLDPGLTTTAPIQREIIRQLEVNRVQCVITAQIHNPMEPNESSRSSGVMILDNYIKRRFQPVRQFDNYTVCRKRISSATIGHAPELER